MFELGALPLLGTRHSASADFLRLQVTDRARRIPVALLALSKAVSFSSESCNLVTSCFFCGLKIKRFSIACAVLTVLLVQYKYVRCSAKVGGAGMYEPCAMHYMHLRQCC